MKVKAEILVHLAIVPLIQEYEAKGLERMSALFNALITGGNTMSALSKFASYGAKIKEKEARAVVEVVVGAGLASAVNILYPNNQRLTYAFGVTPGVNGALATGGYDADAVVGAALVAFGLLAPEKYFASHALALGTGAMTGFVAREAAVFAHNQQAKKAAAAPAVVSGIRIGDYPIPALNNPGLSGISGWGQAVQQAA